uniref:AlNc14C86G5531 protein n=1 Tax=Albugo laibachii Nc14 TaxID=890382 RepID=F0WFZ8_9STRA|nr:AlNc14C86G5531 [Albugo laibachii Nc14]|eukprot:CCA20132.1 AlNc14C86G5531 [Albugo laibachii Nc14]
MGGSHAQQQLTPAKEYVELIIGTPGVSATGLNNEITPPLRFLDEGVHLDPANRNDMYTVNLVVKKDGKIVEQGKLRFGWFKRKLNWMKTKFKSLFSIFHNRQSTSKPSDSRECMSNGNTVWKCKWSELKELINAKTLHVSSIKSTYDVQAYITKYREPYSFTWANGEKPRLYFKAFLADSSPDYAPLNNIPLNADEQSTAAITRFGSSTDESVVLGTSFLRSVFVNIDTTEEMKVDFYRPDDTKKRTMVPQAAKDDEAKMTARRKVDAWFEKLPLKYPFHSNR